MNNCSWSADDPIKIFGLPSHQKLSKFSLLMLEYRSSINWKMLVASRYIKFKLKLKMYLLNPFYIYIRIYWGVCLSGLKYVFWYRILTGCLLKFNSIFASYVFAVYCVIIYSVLYYVAGYWSYLWNRYRIYMRASHVV